MANGVDELVSAWRKDPTNQAINGFFGNLLNSVSDKLLGTGLTGAEREANAFTSAENAIAREFNANQAKIQMDFQERMANTQYQRAVADMQAAGINPALAMSNGGNIAPSGSAGSSSGASSVAPNGGLSMSDILALATLKPQIEALKAQADDTRASAELKRVQTTGQSIINEWNPKIWASEIGLRQSTQDKLAAEVKNILLSAEGQRIYNEFSPRLFESQLQTAEVNRTQMLASIAKIESEIQHMAYQNADLLASVGYKRAMQGLTAAQTALTNLQSESLSVDIWNKEFEKAFREEFGIKPDEPIWNSVTGMLGKLSNFIVDGIKDPVGRLRELFGF